MYYEQYAWAYFLNLYSDDSQDIFVNNLTVNNLTVNNCSMSLILRKPQVINKVKLKTCTRWFFII